jgi:hypothetical protein
MHPSGAGPVLRTAHPRLGGVSVGWICKQCGVNEDLTSDRSDFTGREIKTRPFGVFFGSDHGANTTAVPSGEGSLAFALLDFKSKYDAYVD